MNINDLQLRELHRFAELGRLSASLLHEISNPLSAALLNLESSDHTSPAVRKARSNIQLLRRYVEAARRQVQGRGEPTVFNVKEQVDQIKCVLLPMAKQAGVRLEFGLVPSLCRLSGDPVRFQQIVANLVANAVQAYDKKQTYSRPPRVRVNFNLSAACLTITVSDWGKGIAASELTKLFDLFYTTKATNGLGLGLAIVKQYVAVDFKGSLNVNSSRRLGTKFTVKLPL